MLNSGFVELKLDYSQTKNLAIGAAVCSGNFAAGGHVWRIKCYPRGRVTDMDDSSEYLSLYLELVTHATNVTAVFDAFLLRRDGAPSPAHQNRCVHVFPPRGFAAWGWSHFVHRRNLWSPEHLAGGDSDGRRSVTFVCGVIVMPAGAATGGGVRRGEQPRPHPGHRRRLGRCVLRRRRDIPRPSRRAGGPVAGAQGGAPGIHGGGYHAHHDPARHRAGDI
ncbi:unnamed protein product [Urochloa humidicola]